MMSQSSLIPVFYTRLQRRLHWLVVVLLLLQYALQWPMRAAMLTIESQETLTFTQYLVITSHTWVGGAIAAIAIWRWQLRKRPVPPGAGRMSKIGTRLVKIHHIALYVVLMMMALSGAGHYYLGWEVAARWHELGKWLLVILIGVHVAGALSHLRDGNTVLQRMMGRDSLR